jgi:anti-sigma regulatory factor (Ser/Thr protein kinase)
MVWRRAFPGVAEQAHAAREFVRFLLADFSDVDDVIQVAGELIANALTHTRSGAPGGLYVLEVHRWRGGAALTVLDQGGPTEPRLSNGELSEHGYGLRTVKALATWWNWRGTTQGRIVMAIFITHRTCGPTPP